MNSLLTDDITSAVKKSAYFVSDINGKSYEFHTDTIATGEFTFIQVMAVDITEVEQLNRDLEQKNRELAATGEKLARMIENMESIKVQETRLAMRGRIHDALAQRLTAVHMFLEKTESLNVNELRPLIMDIKADMTQDENSSGDQLRVIVNAFRVIGLNISIRGQIPDGFMDLTAAVLRESATNAVRHANAAELVLDASADNGAFRFTISNDGIPPRSDFTPGGGLTAMRHSIEKAGGNMDIHTAPAFTLDFVLPYAG
jgi:signal transduction histidine kinase